MSPNLDQISAGLTSYLDYLGLPSQSVLVTVPERAQVVNNMEVIVAELDPSRRLTAMYISKFIAACVTGLFDAALNYLWDETIRNLRAKVARFDLEYFYDSVITDPNRRSKLKDENDLVKLDDWELILGCRETGIITQIGYRHLDYIRDMRNYASAAHPNQNELTGLQLVAWLQTCIREVLAKEPEGQVVEVKKLLRSLREEALSQTDVPPIAAALKDLPEDLVRSLLRAVFGMYTDTRLSADVRNNIRLVAAEIWQLASNDVRYETGVKQASFKVHGEVSRAKLGQDFLQLVSGLAYLPSDALSVEIATALDAVLSVHSGWNNFANEYAPAHVLQGLVPASGDVPGAVVSKYVKVLTMCKIGNGYGVSWSAESVYSDLIGRWQDKHIAVFVQLINDPDIASRLQFPSCARNYQSLANQLQGQATNPYLKQALQFLAEFPASVGKAALDSRFKAMLVALKSRL